MLKTREKASDGAINLLRPWFAWWDNLENLSALFLLRDGAVTRQLCEEGHPIWHTLPNGMDQLPEAFVRQLEGLERFFKKGEVKIRKNSPVTEIGQTQDSVIVTYGKKETKLSGDYLVCALPFSTLRCIENLSFSANKMQAIQQLRYATVARVYLQCKKKVWHHPNFNGVVFTDIRKNSRAGLGNCGMNLLDMTLAQKSKKGILQAYLVGGPWP